MESVDLEAFKILSGFLFTTLLGGGLGYVFQKSHAKTLWERARWEKELTESQAAFEEISRLLDRRLYRTRQLLWSLSRSSEARQPWRDEYRKVVCEWNDGINRVLAILMIHFGEEARNSVDYVIGTQLTSIGATLSRALDSKAAPEISDLELRLDGLAGKIYHFNLSLLKHIQARRNCRPH